MRETSKPSRPATSVRQLTNKITYLDRYYVDSKLQINDTLFYYRQEEFENIKGVIRIRKSKKNRQQNDHKKKDQKDKQRSTKTGGVLEG